MNENIPIRFTPSKSGYYKDDSSTKSSSAAPSKNFKKILDKDDESGEHEQGRTEVGEKPKSGENIEGEEIALLEQSARQTAQPVSLFDLSKGSVDKAVIPEKAPAPAKITDPLGGTTEEVVSPNKLFANMNAKKAAPKPFNLDEGVVQPKPKEIVPEKVIQDSVEVSQTITQPQEKIQKPEPYTNFTDKFSREQPDLSYVNPMNVSQQVNPIETSTVKPEVPIQKPNLEALIDQLAKELSVMKTEGKTETTIVLKHPPILEGARVVIQSFDTAKGEVNIKFENLTQAAQQILDQQQNRADLLTNLERRGYNVHIFTTTTYDEPRIMTANVENQNRERREQERGQGQGEGGHRQRDEEEG